MRTAIDKYIIQKVKEKRESMNISQEELTNLLGLATGSAFIGQIESYKSAKQPKYNNIQLNEIAKVLNCSIADFFPDPYLETNCMEEYKKLKEESRGKRNPSVE